MGIFVFAFKPPPCPVTLRRKKKGSRWLGVESEELLLWVTLEEALKPRGQVRNCEPVPSPSGPLSQQALPWPWDRQVGSGA